MEKEELICLLYEASLVVHNMKHTQEELAPEGAFNVTLLTMNRIISFLEGGDFVPDEELDEMFYHDERFMGYYQKEIEELFKENDEK